MMAVFRVFSQTEMKNRQERQGRQENKEHLLSQQTKHLR